MEVVARNSFVIIATREEVAEAIRGVADLESIFQDLAVEYHGLNLQIVELTPSMSRMVLQVRHWLWPTAQVRVELTQANLVVRVAVTVSGGLLLACCKTAVEKRLKLELGQVAVAVHHGIF